MRLVFVGSLLALGMTASCTFPTDVQFNAAGDDGPGGGGGGGFVDDAGNPVQPPRVGCETSAECSGGVCIDQSCFPASATDGVKNGTETDVDCGGVAAPSCGDGKGCAFASDCQSLVCTGGTCQAPSASDGVKNGSETDIDCGGPSAGPCGPGLLCAAPTDCESRSCGVGGERRCLAPTDEDGIQNGTETDIDCGGPADIRRCVADQTCAQGSDCTSSLCTGGTCRAPRYDDNVKNGTETDVDCGGPDAPPANRCATGKICVEDRDCLSDGCVHEGARTGTCASARSCTIVHGGYTCGANETNGDNPAATHEDCCTTIEVPNYQNQEPGHNGERVFLDKYEVTAGRIREFLRRMGAQPNVFAYINNAVPTRWQANWTQFLPSNDVDGIVNPLPHPGNGIAGAAPVGVNYALSYAQYSYSHSYNCLRASGGEYGAPTYWFSNAVLAGLNYAQLPREISKVLLDQKSINCIPNALLAAFCAWDGGQLATAEVLKHVANNGAGLPAREQAITSSDGGQNTGYNYPILADNGAYGRDAAGRIAAPGRKTTDATNFAGAGPWMDLRGNVNEVTLCRQQLSTTGGGLGAQNVCDGLTDGNANWFGLAFEGYGWSSARATQYTDRRGLPEYKTSYAGGRCMRFRD